MDLKAKIQQKQQEVVQSQTEMLTVEAQLEDLKKQHHINIGGLRVLQQLSAEAEAEEAEKKRLEEEKTKQSGKAGEKK
jgi:hypothetical protein